MAHCNTVQDDLLLMILHKTLTWQIIRLDKPQDKQKSPLHLPFTRYAIHTLPSGGSQVSFIISMLKNIGVSIINVLVDSVHFITLLSGYVQISYEQKVLSSLSSLHFFTYHCLNVCHFITFLPVFLSTVLSYRWAYVNTAAQQPLEGILSVNSVMSPSHHLIYL